MDTSRTRVLVTGLGVVSALGCGAGRFFARLLSGQSGIRPLPEALAERLHCKVAARCEEPLQASAGPLKLEGLDRATQFALVAAEQAVAQAGLALPPPLGARVGVSMGTGMGGAGTTEEAYERLLRRGAERLKPGAVVTAMNNAAAAWLSIRYGLQGPQLNFSVACASSAVAIGEAARLIRHGYADVMLAGGTEALLTYVVIKAWEGLRALAHGDREHPEASCRPFSADRAGLVLGEGAAVLVLESEAHARARGARVYAELAGYACGSDATHIAQPHAAGQVRVMHAALADAELAPEQVDYVNAHGTATAVGDAVETQALKSVFGAHAARLAVSSTKSMHGHTLGASGALEFAATVLALHEGALPPTAHLRVPDPQCDLDYVPNRARRADGLRSAISNSFAFGGCNAALVARPYAPSGAARPH